MKQIIVIHGGTTFSHYDKYVDFLRTKSVNLDRLMYSPSWKNSLQTKLGDGYQVLLPSMPNATNAQYSEWKLWFDRIVEIVEDDCILVGHSLGAAFLVKYLSENTPPISIAVTILIAAPYDDESIEDLTEFKIDQISDRFKQNAGRTILFNGDDDPVIPMTELTKYKTELPSAEFNVLSAPDHFNRVDFPELISVLRTI